MIDRTKKLFGNTELEKQVLVSYANGYTFQEIGEQIGVSGQTVEACLRRLGVRTKDASRLVKKRVSTKMNTAPNERIKMLETTIQ